MAKVAILVDTDVFIDYLNTGRFSGLFDRSRFTVHYSVVTRKELLAKRGLGDAEKRAIFDELRQHRLIRLSVAIVRCYSDLRVRYPTIEKEDALIAASALVRRLPLVTKNKKHFRRVAGLALFGP
jgi:predicted nucleic acid-binding protein